MKFGCFTRNGRVVYAEPFEVFQQSLGLYLQFSSGAKKLECDEFEYAKEDTNAYWNCKVNDHKRLEKIEEMRREDLEAVMYFHQELAHIRAQGDKANRHMLEIHGQANIGEHYVECIERIVAKVRTKCELTILENEIWRLERYKYEENLSEDSILTMIELQLATWKSRKDSVLMTFLIQLKKAKVEF